MTLDKAREILELNLQEAGKQMPADTKAALIISLEAIGYVEQSRRGSGSHPAPPLPHETKD